MIYRSERASARRHAAGTVLTAAAEKAAEGLCKALFQKQLVDGMKKIMKYTNMAMLALTASVVLVGCNKEKSVIEDRKEAKTDAIDNRKDAVDVAAKDAKKQAEIDAKVDKAKIEANKDATQAQLDAEKKKAEAQAAFEKAKVDAEKK
jgi:hypothetical protein